MKPILNLSAMLLTVVFCTSSAVAQRHGKPNIVFLLADDLGYRELGSYGQQRIRTPHLDQLAAQGMRLTQHYAGNAVCATSRCVLMTGKHPGHAYIRTNKAIEPEGQYPIPDSEVTLAELLHDEGYVSGGFGKWGLGGPGTSGEPLRQGFDRFFGYNCQRHAHSYYPSYLWSDDQRITLNNAPPIPGHAKLPIDVDASDPRSYDRFKGTDYAPDRINEQALQFVRANKDRPFFLYYPTVIPHVALHVPDEELQQYLKLGWEETSFTGRGRRGYTPHFTPKAAYAAMITRMDRYIGNLLKLLDELQLTDNTIVIFTSDNGTTALEAEVDHEFFNSVGKLRGLKGSLYEGGIRVPGIVRWPGKVAAGSVSDRISGFEDWMPTLLELIGTTQSLPADIDGISLAATLRGQPQPPRPFLYREFPSYGVQQSIRVANWKAVRQNMSRGNVQTELYNLAEDISESKNIADQYPDVLADLEKRMEQEHTPSALFPLASIDDQ